MLVQSTSRRNKYQCSNSKVPCEVEPSWGGSAIQAAKVDGAGRATCTAVYAGGPNILATKSPILLFSLPHPHNVPPA